MPASVMMQSTCSTLHLLAKPLLLNLELSANTITCSAASTIFALKLASLKLVVESPNSISIPSTPRNSTLQDIICSAISATGPTTAADFGLTAPPNCINSTFNLLLNSNVTLAAGVIAASGRDGYSCLATSHTVVPEPISTLACPADKERAAVALGCFCTAWLSAFWLVDRCVVQGLSED